MALLNCESANVTCDVMRLQACTQSFHQLSRPLYFLAESCHKAAQPEQHESTLSQKHWDAAFRQHPLSL